MSAPTPANPSARDLEVARKLAGPRLKPGALLPVCTCRAFDSGAHEDGCGTLRVGDLEGRP